ncbi:transport protein ComB [Bacilli bacterium]|nr:transport protein ComB [Bacilli bacterium]
MNQQLFESAEFYKRRYGNFSVYLIIPTFLLLTFLIIFSVFAKKEITIQSVGEIAPMRSIAKIQSTSDNTIIENKVINNQVVKKGQTLITYSGTITDSEINKISAQMAQVDKQIANLETLKQGIDTGTQTFAETDEFGYQSTLDNHLTQIDLTSKEFEKANADIGNQNATVASTQDALITEIDNLSQKIDRKRSKRDDEKDSDKRELLTQEIEQLDSSLSSLNTQVASSGGYRTLDNSLAAKLDNLKTSQLATADKALVELKASRQELAQNLILAQETQKNNKLVAQESGIIRLDTENKNKKIIPTGTTIAEIMPSITDETKLEVDYYVDSSALTGLKIGQKIRFTSDKKLSDQLVMTGKIEEIAKSATPVEGKNFFLIKAEIYPKDKERQQLIYGMQGRISSIIDQKTFFNYYKDKIFSDK